MIVERYGQADGGAVVMLVTVTLETRVTLETDGHADGLGVTVSLYGQAVGGPVVVVVTVFVWRPHLVVVAVHSENVTFWVVVRLVPGVVHDGGQ